LKLLTRSATGEDGAAVIRNGTESAAEVMIRRRRDTAPVSLIIFYSLLLLLWKVLEE